jgi:hypothetical protein
MAFSRSNRRQAIVGYKAAFGLALHAAHAGNVGLKAASALAMEARSRPLQNRSKKFLQTSYVVGF